MTSRIAIVGMACEYPEAHHPEQLWENVLGQRQSFRRIPPERLSLRDYFAADRGVVDATYASRAALIDGWEFDRVRFRVAGATYRAVDPVHWLALDVAARALADAGFPGGHGLERRGTGVLVGNTLTGETSRALALRLRWPYVRRVAEHVWRARGMAPEQQTEFLAELEAEFKRPFPEPSGETLAGGMANTIAGRICNHFDLGGGGFAVDGACASSLLAVSQACSSLAVGDLDAAVVGGVDVSLDPFELVGFARTGALAADEMRVYDRDATGFHPGEGCGFVVLVREEDARARGLRSYAVLVGWGVSSDGSGGITRPETDGQKTALRRAYRRAGFGIDTVGYFEGHGTGTPVGDAVELRALAEALDEGRGRNRSAEPAALGSVKANIGHTKAAAGIAGMIKAALAVHHEVQPPATGVRTPHPLLGEDACALRLLRGPRPWPEQRPVRAAVSSMGFGGINVHVVLEEATSRRTSRGLSPRHRRLAATPQDAELFVLTAADEGALAARARHLAGRAAGMSQGELADCAARLCGDARAPADRATGVRAALVAATPDELAAGLDHLAYRLASSGSGHEGAETSTHDMWIGSDRQRAPRIGFLFPGMGAPVHAEGGIWRRRFASVNDLYGRFDAYRAGLPPALRGRDARVAQPAIATACQAGLAVLAACRVDAARAVGHSFGELIAMHWAGIMDEPALEAVVAARGRAVAECVREGGAMAGVATDEETARRLLAGTRAGVAAVNAPGQTIVSGPADAVAEVVARATAQGVRAVRLAVAYPFHSELMGLAADRLRTALHIAKLRAPQRTMFSTVTGGELGSELPRSAIADLLCRQLVSPVRFNAALLTASEAVDMWIEVGPGRVLSDLARRCGVAPARSMDVGGEALRPLLCVLGELWARGAALDLEPLFAGRELRAFDPDHRPIFLANPCEQAPVEEYPVASLPMAAGPERAVGAAMPKAPVASDRDPLGVLRELLAERTELPAAAITPQSRMLADLHLNSIVVAELVAAAARQLGQPPPGMATEFANASVDEIASFLSERIARPGAGAAPLSGPPPGIASWARAFRAELVVRERPRPRRAQPGSWRVLAPPGHSGAGELRRILGGAGAGSGVAVWLQPEPDAADLDRLLTGVEHLFAMQPPRQLAVIQHAAGGAGFAKSLHLEHPDVTTCVIDLPEDADAGEEVRWVAAEIRAARGYREVHYDADGVRREPQLRVLPLAAESDAGGLPLGADDVVAVTGGGKGIAAECALDLAARSSCRLLLIGRSDPERDPELRANLERCAAAGIAFCYARADVTDADAVAAAVTSGEAALGPVTAVMHGAGTNTPAAVRSLDPETCRATLAPKVDGLAATLAAVDPDRLKLLVGFGSLIARVGLPGEAHYALANEWLSAAIERFGAGRPGCRCLCVEWSVWAGVGMGERLGSVERLRREGIEPLSTDAGLRTLRQLLDLSDVRGSVVVAGRFGQPPTLRLAGSDLPLLRFLEYPLLHVPGVELVAEAELTAAKDPYLADHCLDDVYLLPGVLAVEAMAQVARALTGSEHVTEFSDVVFARPIPVGADRMRIRIAALQRAPDAVEVAVRSAGTDFAVDHCRALCRFGPRESDVLPEDLDGIAVERDGPGRASSELSVRPDRDLYGAVLFQRGRFRRVVGYDRLEARVCAARIASSGSAPWFGVYLPQTLVLADPGARDAALHAVQACIPHARILPIGVERIVRLCEDVAIQRVWGRERAADGNTFVWDLAMGDAAGDVAEVWLGLELRNVPAADPLSVPRALLGPYLERRLPGLRLREARTAVLPVGRGARRAASAGAIERAVGRSLALHRRPDGKLLVVDSELQVSAAHHPAGDLVVAVAGNGPVACDLETVHTRPRHAWRDLLGTRYSLAEFVARECREDFSVAATRMWCAGECLAKAAEVPGPLVFAEATPDGWVVFASGALRIATYRTIGIGADDAVVAVLLEETEGNGGTGA